MRRKIAAILLAFCLLLGFGLTAEANNQPASAAIGYSTLHVRESPYNNQIAVQGSARTMWPRPGYTVGSKANSALKFYVPLGICVEYGWGGYSRLGPTYIGGHWIDIPKNSDTWVREYIC